MVAAASLLALRLYLLPESSVADALRRLVRRYSCTVATRRFDCVHSGGVGGPQ